MNEPPLVSIAVSSVIPPGPSIHSVLSQLLNRSDWYVFTGSPSCVSLYGDSVDVQSTAQSYGFRLALFITIGEVPMFVSRYSRISSRFDSGNGGAWEEASACSYCC